MQQKSKKVFKRLLIALILITLAFIFVQSMLPRETSAKESDSVSDIVAGIVPPETKPGAFLQVNIRKVAHFLEFALLGAEISLYVFLFLRKNIVIYLSLLAAPLFGMIDETIQIYSGRGSSFFDTLIDASGYISAAVVFYTAGALILYMSKNVNKTRQNATEK